MSQILTEVTYLRLCSTIPVNRIEAEADRLCQAPQGRRWTLCLQPESECGSECACPGKKGHKHYLLKAAGR